MVGNFRSDPNSEVEQKIEAAMERHFVMGTDSLYAPALNGDVCAILNTKYQWQMGCSAWRDDLGETVFVSWVENGKLHMMGWDVLYD